MMKEKRMKESTVWQIAAHAVMITGSVLAVFPFVLLVIASFTDNQTALMNGYRSEEHTSELQSQR